MRAQCILSNLFEYRRNANQFLMRRTSVCPLRDQFLTLLSAPDEFIQNLSHNFILITTQPLMKGLNLRITILVVLAAFAVAQNCRQCTVPYIQPPPCQNVNYSCYKCYGAYEVLDMTSLLCTCSAGYYRIQGVCTVCPAGTAYNPLTQWCEGNGNSGYCGYNQYYDPVSKYCYCNPGTYLIMGTCSSCPANSYYDPNYGVCRCQQDYSLVNNTCILIPCRPNQYYDPISQTCVCSPGYYLINNVCGQCSGNLVYNPYYRQCVPPSQTQCGLNEYFYQCCCFCSPGYSRINGVCTACPPNSHFDWSQNCCVGDNGYIMINGVPTWQPPANYGEHGYGN